MNAEVLEHDASQKTGQKILIDRPICDLVIAVDEQQFSASYDRETYGDSVWERKNPDDTDDIVANLHEATTVISAKPSYSLFGFSVETPSPGIVRITGPANPVLNDRRAELAANTGIHTGVFVDTDDEFVDFLDFARQLSDRTIPMSVSSSRYTAHDNFFHRLGYSKMSEAIFDRYAKAAGMAAEANDAAWAEDIISSFDHLSGRLTYDSVFQAEDLAAHLVLYYKKYMHPLAAGVFAARDARAQVETDQNLRDLAAVQPEHHAAD